jgi:tetratricopeptide (TPR) repeat protein
LFNQALTLFEHTDNYIGQVNCLFEIGADENRRMLIDKASCNCDLALKSALKCGDEQCHAKALFLRGRIWANQNAFSEAMESYNEAREFAHGPELTGNILMYMASCCQYTNMLDDAVKFADKALQIFEDSGDRFDISELKRYISLNCYLKNNYQQALKPGMESLELKKELNDKLGEARISVILGIIYNELGDLTKALAYPLNALKLNESIADRKVNLVALQNIAVVYTTKDDFSEALKCYRQALQEYDHSIDKRELSWYHFCVGNIQQGFVLPKKMATRSAKQWFAPLWPIPMNTSTILTML